MQQLLASLVVGLSVKDTAYRAGMSAARAEAKKTGQDFEREGERMSGAIERAARTVNAAAVRIVDSVANVGREAQGMGIKLTAGLTLPLGLAGKAAKDTAADFQSSMNRVRAAMVNANPDQIEKLRGAALTLGPAMGKSAIEAADAIEMLAKNGMSAADILNGGLASALQLGVLGQTGLSNAADLTTDIMTQFSKTSGDLPMIVDRVTGALDASKMSFDDYRLAAGQAGGLVGALGYSFEDFNTALAATAPLFDSGSDAGTSFRTFLSSLNAKSEDAERTMKKLGLSFYEADGRARPLAQIADELQKKMSNLSDRSKSEALTNLFGADGARTALALMKLGFEGVETARKQIASVTADQKLAILLDGEAAATQRVASAWERLKITVGEAGLIQAYTAVKEAIASTLAVVGSAPPWFYKLVVAAGLAGAAIGPLTLAALSLAKLALPLLLLRLGPVALGMAAIINPAGVLIRLLGQLALQAGAATIIGRLGTTLIGVAGPLGLVATVLAIVIPYLTRAGQASDAARAAGDKLADSNAAVAQTAQALATAEGKARDAVMAKAKADRQAAADAIKKAKADMVAARAALVRAKAASQGVNRAAGAAAGPLSAVPGIGGALSLAGRTAAYFGGNRAVSDAEAELRQRNDNTAAALKNFYSIDALIKEAEAAVTAPTVDMSFDKPDTERKKREKKDRTAENEARYQDELGRIRVDQLRAEADLTESARDRYTAEMAAIAEERASFVRQNAVDDSLTDAKRAALLAAKDEELGFRRAIAERARSVELAEIDAAMARDRNEAEQEMLRAQIDLADNVTDRHAGELRLLDLQRQQEAADLELILATKATTSAEWANAHQAKERLDEKYAALRAGVDRQNETAGQSYLRELNRSPAAIAEQVEAMRIDALKGLNQDLTDAVMGTKKLADAFADMGKRIVASLLDIAIQQRVIKPLAESLLGSSGGGGGGFLSGLASMLGFASKGAGLAGGITGPDMLTPATINTGTFAPIDLPNFGGFRAEGGGVKPNEWVIVGEEGPEVFAPGVSGTVIPNGGRGAGRRGDGKTIVQLVADEGAMFVPRVTGIAGDVSVETVGRSNRTQARAAKRRLR